MLFSFLFTIIKGLVETIHSNPSPWCFIYNKLKSSCMTMGDLEEVSPITTFTSPSSSTSSFNSKSSSEGGTSSNSSVGFNNSKQFKQSWPRHSSLLKLEHFFQFCILFWGEKKSNIHLGKMTVMQKWVQSDSNWSRHLPSHARDATRRNVTLRDVDSWRSRGCGLWRQNNFEITSVWRWRRPPAGEANAEFFVTFFILGN